MLTITITDPPFSFVADTTETVLNFTVSDQVGPAGPSYTLPTASDTVLGGVKVGSGLTITAGVLSVSGSSYTLPIATGSVLGGIKVGDGLTITDGVLSVSYTYTLPIATGSVLGGIKSSTDILVDAGTGVATVNGSTGGNGAADSGKVVKFGSLGEFSASNNFVVTASATSSDPDAKVEMIGGKGASGARVRIYKTLTISGNFSCDNLTAARTYQMPDASGTFALTSDIPSLSGYQTTAGTLALGGFSSITGTLAIANVAAETATRLATAFNAGTEDATAADTDRIAVTSPAGGWMSLTTLWTWITGKLSAAFYRPLIVKKSTAQIDVTSSTTFTNITGLTGYSLEANSTYRLEFFGEVTAGASGGYKIAITSTQAFKHTTSGTQGLGGFWPTGGTAGAPFQLSSTQIQINSRTAASTALPVVTIAIITTGANAPTIDFQFAQNASNATTSSLLTGAVGSFTKLI